MKKLIYRLSMLVAIITFVTNVMNNITIPTAFLRTIIAFLIMLFLSVIALKFIHWTLMMSKKKPSEEIVKSRAE